MSNASGGVEWGTPSPSSFVPGEIGQRATDPRHFALYDPLRMEPVPSQIVPRSPAAPDVPLGLALHLPTLRGIASVIQARASRRRMTRR